MIKTKLLSFCVFFFVFIFKIFAEVNEQPYDEFIESVFEIKIPGLEGAYNASIVEYDDGYLMAFRHDTYRTPIGYYLEDFHQYIGLIKLDENFQITSLYYPCLGNRTYDPRLLKIKDTIYLIYACPNSLDPHSVFSSHLELGTIYFSEDGVSVNNCMELCAPFQRLWEKNWVPFNYKDRLLLAYTINPHIILKPSLSDGTCGLLCKTDPPICWSYGSIRGSTQASLVDGDYLGFFHSYLQDPVTGIHNYYVGAYTFSNKPPFGLLKISPKAFSHPDFYSAQKNALAFEKNVIFPGGFFVKGNKIYMSFGENDEAIKIMIIDKKKLFESMIDTNKEIKQ